MDKLDHNATARARIVAIAAGLSVIALWLLTHPYPGIQRDAMVYVGRALADLDPAGIGRQIDYIHDGQSRFSVFTVLCRHAVAWLGPGAAAQALSAIGLASFIAAAAFLASRFASGAKMWAALVVLAVLPTDYGSLFTYHAAEPLATPRIFAEAASLTALALFVSGRRICAALALLAALALHPLMALGAIAVAWLLLAAGDRRWLIASAAAGVALIAAALVGAPVASRLFESFDPAWRATIELRTSPVFVALWPQGSWALLVCQLATAILAASTATDPLRRLLQAVSVVAVAGIAVAAIPSVLLVQLQPWRAQWLLAVMAALGFPLAAAGLWKNGTSGRAALLLLAIAWLARDSLSIATTAAVFSVFLGLRPEVLRIPEAGVRLLFAAVIALAAATTALRVIAVAPGFDATLGRMLLMGVHTVVFAAIAVAVAIRFPAFHDRRIQIGALTAALVLFAASIRLWDDRSPFTRWAEENARTPPLHAVLRSGSVYWVHNYGVGWLLTGLPEWWSPYAGAAVVFDRRLALAWSGRHTIAASAGLAPRGNDIISVTPKMIARLCGARDGPDWLIAPAAELRSTAKADRVWRAGAPLELTADGKRLMVSDHAVFACSRGR